MQPKNQFFRIEGYARSASTRGTPTSKTKSGKIVQREHTKSGLNIQEVVDEAIRELGSCPHVKNPEIPTFLVGDINTMKTLPSRIDDMCTKYDAQSGKSKLRKDHQILLTGIASYPKLIPQFKPEDEDDIRLPELDEDFQIRKTQYLLDYDEWKTKNLDFATSKYGDDLVCVLEHLDEENPHLHFYMLSNKINPSVRNIHDGYIAEDLAGCNKLTSKTDRNIIHQTALKKLQDDYYSKVGQICAMTRTGPKLKRLSRAAHLERTKEAHFQAAQLKKINTQFKQVNANFDTVERISKTLNDRELELEQQKIDLNLSIEQHNINKRNLQTNRDKVQDQLTKIELLQNELIQDREKLKDPLRQQDNVILFYKNKLAAKNTELNAKQDEVLKGFKTEFDEAVFKNANRLLNEKHKAQQITPQIKQSVEWLKKDSVILEVVHASITRPDIAEKIRELVDWEDFDTEMTLDESPEATVFLQNQSNENHQRNTWTSNDDYSM